MTLSFFYSKFYIVVPILKELKYKDTKKLDKLLDCFIIEIVAIA
ncbi:hypothetical protein GTCCBUS3UF5_20380 [Geobacillus thermoleovorans CCB_US3_UF5]|uniref:Uncharacterized protein n=3 Tax=Geobacillus TaxID=129337 RepID=A0A7U9J8E9_GEOTM|nr:hypothetical protein GTCCBUS3UF5_20380 [Geobacillus thermoleovorans CCB_US3_UF5]ESU70819.1 hypothetical protein T260_17025 [Geobacillus sp. MAS1]GAD14997.1 hypothetical protein GBL_3214 [Geobacillus kaustophilus GBlys]GAJ58894.1 hypothetical protein B23_2107 [Geobacillus thermoleovorans B23]